MRIGKADPFVDQTIEVRCGNLVVGKMSLNVPDSKIVCQDHDDVGAVIRKDIDASGGHNDRENGEPAHVVFPAAVNPGCRR